MVFEFLFQQMESPSRASTGEKIASKNCWIRYVIGFFGALTKKQLSRRLRISTQQQERLLNMTNVLCCFCGKGVETPARVFLSGTIFGVVHSNCNSGARINFFQQSSSIIDRDMMLTIHETAESESL